MHHTQALAAVDALNKSGLIRVGGVAMSLTDSGALAAGSVGITQAPAHWAWHAHAAHAAAQLLAAGPPSWGLASTQPARCRCACGMPDRNLPCAPLHAGQQWDFPNVWCAHCACTACGLNAACLCSAEPRASRTRQRSPGICLVHAAGRQTTGS